MITARQSLKAILALALGGVAFSGYLTYQELFASCTAGCAPVGEAGTILGYPPCLYGLVMYAAVASCAILGLRAKK